MGAGTAFVLKLMLVLCCLAMAVAESALGQGHIDGSVAEQHLAVKVPPTYPPLAKMARIQGDVLLDVVIGADGSVGSIKTISGPPILVPAAIEAVKQWRYSPFVLEGSAVPVSTQVKVNFTRVDDDEDKPSAVRKEDNLYSIALFMSLEEMQKSWGGFNNSDYGDSIRTDYHHMVVESNPVITDHLLAQHGDYCIEIMDLRAQIDRYRKLGKKFAILRIHPIENVGAGLQIEVSTSYFGRYKRRWSYAFSDWSVVNFRYDCTKQKFVVDKVKLGGI